MLIIAVDNIAERLEKTTACLQDYFTDSRVVSFIDPLLAAKYCFDNKPDLLCTEMKMVRMSGVALAEMFRVRYPQVKLCFVADNEQYLQQAQAFDGSCYLVRPLSPEQIGLQLAQSGNTERVRGGG